MFFSDTANTQPVHGFEEKGSKMLYYKHNNVIVRGKI